jgi:anti-sigma factor RsiW
MDCAEAAALLDAYADGELPLERGLAFEGHLESCRLCSEELAARRALGAALRETPYQRAPDSLRRAVLARLPEEAPVRPRPSAPQWLRLAASFLLVAGLSSTLTYYLTPRSAGPSVAEEVFASHIRGVQSDNRLIDVPSSDEHTVKPWFTDKLDFSPPVKDLSAEGFPLVGGRLDYVDNRTVAALVYRYRKHLITLFIWPSTARDETIRASARNGDNLNHWSDGAMTYWAVSDVAAPELLEFSRRFQAAGSSEVAPPPVKPKQP